MRRLTICCFMGLALFGAAQAAEPISNESREFFEARIRPVLVDQCYSCHNSTKQADGELRLDSRDGLRKGGENGAIIVPGKPNESRLLPILRHETPGLKMPQGGARLTDQVIADFEKWIASGAPDPRDHPPSAEELTKATSWEAILAKRKKWWSLQPVKAVALPTVSGKPWSDHPVDRFILSKLREHELEPTDRALAPALVRRAFFAVIGLPPTVEEVQHWVPRVSQPNGFEELVDHLLASPHFGERWARHWMDWVRYCDSHGSEGDPSLENGWLYRDYLIRALNADLPYDQLVREQIAGDLLEESRINTALGINESLVATAHWRMVFHGFSPTDALDEKTRFIDDQINAFSKAFMGLTVSCARCHDHKFDAISQKDYYALFGILSACRPGRSAMDTPEKLAVNRDKLAELKPKIRTAIAASWTNKLPSVRAKLLADDGAWKKADNPRQLLHAWSQFRSDLAKGQPLETAWQRRVDQWNNERAARKQSAERESFKRWSLNKPDGLKDWTQTGSGLSGVSPAGEFAVAVNGDSMLVGIYPAGVYSHRLSDKHPARLTSHDLKVDGEYVVYLRTLGEGSSGRYVVYDYPREGTVYPVAQFKNEWQWARLDLSYWSGDVIHMELTDRADAPLMARQEPRSWFGAREIVILKKSEPPPHEPLEFLDPWFELATSQAPASLEQAADQFVAALSQAVNDWSRGSVSDAQALFLDASMKQGLLPQQLEDSSVPTGSDKAPTAAQLIAEYRRLEAEIPTATRVPTLEEASERTQPLYIRGNHTQPSEIVPRGFLSVLNPEPYPATTSGRRQLADDLLNPNNPLTRRVIVNRLWHHLFGRGIVGTPDNFGQLGHLPTHPELLDYLATKFLQEGGSLKKMIRYLVTSQTWQLASKPSEQATARDPDNNWLSHAHVKRLEAEAIRDSLLLVSGQLNRDLYGAPVDGRSPRRSVYMRVQRNALDPFLRAFDFPEPFTCVGRRDVTNVPAQSLTMMNDDRVSSLADAWSLRILVDRQPSDDARIQKMFQSAFARLPQPDETQRLRRYLALVTEQKAETAKKVAHLKQLMDLHQLDNDKLLAAARDLLQAAAKDSRSIPTVATPQPISSWRFQSDLNDPVGNRRLELHNGATLLPTGIHTNRGGFATSIPLDKPLKAKTLEVWVQLDTLDQQGGGAMTVQSQSGEFFDSIVYAERAPRQWMAGSNFFERTSPFDGPAETEAAERPVHFAIAYHPDGVIAGYRDGQPYGKTYQSKGPHEFKAGDAIVSFGIHHLPAGGNHMLAARLIRANLYDRALTAEEVAATSQALGYIPTESQLLAAMNEETRRKFTENKLTIAELRKEIENLSSPGGAPDSQSEWADLARTLFLFKEFLFIQ